MTAEPEFPWTQDDWGVGSSPAEPPPWRQFVERHGWAVRGAIVLLALIVFELTANAALATAVSCLELGRTDFVTAHWLWRVDPNRHRGRLTALCYVAAGCGRVGLTAFLVSASIACFAVWVNPGPGPLVAPGQLAGALWMLILAVFVCSTLSVGVCLAALLTRRKIWLGPEPGLARRQGIWPPSRNAITQGSRNQVEAWIGMGCRCFVVSMIGGVAYAITLVATHQQQWFLLLMVAGMGACGLWATDWAEEQIRACLPAECWPIDESATTASLWDASS